MQPAVLDSYIIVWQSAINVSAVIPLAFVGPNRRVAKLPIFPKELP
jgi:hypothetical protein